MALGANHLCSKKDLSGVGHIIKGHTCIPSGNSQRLRFPMGTLLQLPMNMSSGQRVHSFRPVVLPSGCKVGRLVSGYRLASLILI